MNEETLQVIKDHISSNKEQYVAMGSVDKAETDGE